MVETANSFNLGMDEDDVEKLMEVILKELTDEELFELEQESMAEEEVRDMKTTEEKEPSRKFIVNGLAEAITGLNKFLKMFENVNPNI